MQDVHSKDGSTFCTVHDLGAGWWAYWYADGEMIISDDIERIGLDSASVQRLREAFESEPKPKKG